ncbi:MAG: ATP-binding protein [Spirochaetota bacterium]
MSKIDVSVLYVEDDEWTLKEITRILQEWVREVFAVTNVKEGLCIFEKYNPDLLVIDIVMPDINGLEMIKNIRDRKTPVKIIITSGHTDTDYLLKAISLNVDSFILKPITEEKLLPAIQRASEAIFMARKIRQQEMELKEREARFRAAFESAKDAILWTDSNTEIIFNCNKAAEELIGRTREEIIGEHQSILHPLKQKNFYSLMLKKLMEIYGNLDQEAEILHKSGRLIPVHISGSIATMEGKKIIQSIFHDLTEQKAIQQALKEAKQAAGTASEEKSRVIAMKDRFFSIIAHDLKGPLSGFLSVGKLLQDAVAEMDLDLIKEVADALNESAANLFKLLENLLEWASLQQDMYNPEPSVLDINELITESLRIFNPNIQQKNIEVINDLKPELHTLADVNMIRTIVRNLLSNAIKFTNKSGKIEIRGEETDNGMIRISVKDNGIGISSEKLAKLFKISEKVTAPGTTGEKGTGLGLLLSKELAEKNGGTLSVESEPGKGTRFMLCLPGVKVKAENSLGKT